ncbi:hypothetical protein PanWU01x14_315370 [Parasponia andersonii]|uniref:Uncharacterized protein n=1 Tax=Parasponia andersonii TaxID=3476 RepID=A0A2P5ANJ1_PARAD|nr:hypothetical protein PanWU01x14_315370 [Parasponia andersonii]
MQDITTTNNSGSKLFAQSFTQIEDWHDMVFYGFKPWIRVGPFLTRQFSSARKFLMSGPSPPLGSASRLPGHRTLWLIFFRCRYNASHWFCGAVSHRSRGGVRIGGEERPPLSSGEWLLERSRSVSKKETLLKSIDLKLADSQRDELFCESPKSRQLEYVIHGRTSPGRDLEKDAAPRLWETTRETHTNSEIELFTPFSP